MRLALSAIALFAGLSTVAQAQPAPGDSSRANKLFDLGFKLKSAGQLEEGCRWIQESFEISPGLGAQLQLADCRAKLGMRGRAALDVAELSARLAEARARDPGGAARLERIEKDAAALGRELDGEAAALPTLHIEVPAALEKCRGLRIVLDGVRLDPARWRAPVPVDPGHHVVVALSGRKPVAEAQANVVAGSYALTLSAPKDDACGDGAPPGGLLATPGPATGAAPPAAGASEPGKPQILVFVVPNLPGAAGAGNGPSTGPLPAGAGASANGSAGGPEAASGRTTGRDIGIGASLAVGAAGVALGVGFGVAFLAERDDYVRSCAWGRATCNDGRSSDRRYSDIVQLRTVETIAFVTGATGFAVAGILWSLPLLRGRPLELAAAPEIGPRHGAITVSGEF